MRAHQSKPKREPKVLMVFTGGTISMRYDPLKGGATSVLDARGIIERTPGLGDIANIEPLDWGRVPATHLSFSQLFELRNLLRDALADERYDGAVLIQGTDNIEEVSFAFDLLLDSEKPVIVVGAMRNAFEEGYEGPVNLRDAVRCAASQRLKGQGVLVVMAGTIHSADDVVKTNTYSYATFQSPNLGPLGFVDEGEVIVRRRRVGRRHISTEVAGEPVALFKVYLGADGSIIRLATRAGARGLVVEGAGTGNTPLDVLTASVEAMQAGIPVVMATRCSAGSAKPMYAFPGGGATWRDAGALFAGYISGLKARLMLSLAVGGGMAHEQLAELFQERTSAVGEGMQGQIAREV